MPDFSYISRSLLGIGTPSNFKYDGSFAASVFSQNAALASENISVDDPSHIFFSSSSVLSTELNLPGVAGATGPVTNGLTYYIKNTRDKGTNRGDNYMINVNVTDPSAGVKTIIKLYEQDTAKIVYDAGTSTWQLVSHMNMW